MVFRNRAYPVFRDTSRPGIVVFIMCKCFAVKTIQTAKISTDPQSLGMVNKQAYHDIIAQAVYLISIVKIIFKYSFFSVKINEAAAVRPNPDVSGLVLGETINITETQTV